MSKRPLFYVVGLMLVLAGCSSPPIHWSTSAIGVFPDYQAVFRFIAEQERLPDDSGTLFRLAADSEIRVWYFENMPVLYVVTARYYAGGKYDQIRGAQGNGRFYVLRTLAHDFSAVDNTDRGFELAGIAEGNSYTWQTINGQLRLITRWHVSVAESPTTTYAWNGKTFSR